MKKHLGEETWGTAHHADRSSLCLAHGASMGASGAFLQLDSEALVFPASFGGVPLHSHALLLSAAGLVLAERLEGVVGWFLLQTPATTAPSDSPTLARFGTPFVIDCPSSLLSISDKLVC